MTHAMHLLVTMSLVILMNTTDGKTAPLSPLSAPWSGPHGGVPPFDRVVVKEFRPALEAAIAEKLAEIEKIASDPAPATFDNTLAALERAGATLRRVETVFDVFASTLGTPEVQAVEREIAPRLAEVADRITQNARLFKRIEAVYQSPDKARWSPEKQRLAWLYHTDFVRAGARLGAPEKQRLTLINRELAELFTRFSQNLLADETDQWITLEREQDLAGLPASERESAAAAAAEKKLAGKWVIANTRSAVLPFLTFADRRDLREKVWRMFVNRGDNGGKTDTKDVITRVLSLRAERAKLLGFATHAHWRLDNTMAKTPDRAVALMEAVWKPAVARVREEVRDMQALADKDGAKLTIEPWDYRYFAERVRKARYDLDQNQVKPYLQLEKLREGMFWVAGKLFGFAFSPLDGIPVPHPDVRVWEVKDQESGRHVGLWYFDPFAREGKRSGAWMSAYRAQDRLDGEVSTIVSNNSNFVKGSKPGQPVLIAWDDARTLLHEFGHALHGLSSQVTYRSLSGTEVATDYVEFPSQLLEHWMSTPELLGKFALHYQTGQPIPQELVAKIERASTFNSGFATTELLASALVDMKLHLAGDRKIDPRVFEKETLAALGCPREIVMRHRTPQFGHVFSGDGYAAGYYSYLWSDVLNSDAYTAFTEAGGPYDPAVAKRLRQFVLSVGNTVDPAEAYRAFRGRDPTVDALMKRRGFPTIPAR